MSKFIRNKSLIKRGNGMGLLLLLFQTAALTWAAGGANEPVEGSVALVNGAAISEQELNREVDRLGQQLGDRGSSLPQTQRADLREQALQNLIGRELLYQESQKQGFKPQQAEIQKEFDSLKAQFPKEEDFQAALQRVKHSEASLKIEIRRSMAIGRFVKQRFEEKISLSEKESRAYYQAHPELFKQPERVRARHILIAVAPEATEAQKSEARQKIERVQQRLKEGEDFALLAQELSEGPSKERGGDLGFFERGQMVEPFERAAFVLKPGEVSDLVETRYGFHLIKVEDKSPERTIPFAEIRERLDSYLKQEKVQEGITEFLETSRAGAEIKILNAP